MSFARHLADMSGMFCTAASNWTYLSIAHGTRKRNFAKYLGLAANTDQVDARMLALFAAKSEDLRLWQPPSTETVELRGLRRRRDDLAQIIRTEQNRLEHPQIKAVERSMKRHVRAMTKEMDELDSLIAKLIATTPEFRRKSDLLTSVVGVAPKRLRRAWHTCPNSALRPKAKPPQ